MKNLEELLIELKRLLQDEKRLLIESIKNREASEQVLHIVEQKENILNKIFGYNKEDFENFQDLLKEIDELTQSNRALALNNIEFINEIFDALFSTNAPTQYTKDGNLSGKKEGLLNKKV